VRLNYQFLSGWDVFPLEFREALPLPWQSVSPGRAATFYRGCLEIENPADTFLRVEGIHGIVWINDFCLGRYWNIGPQKTLYVPAPLLRKGGNELVIFEVEGDATPRATFEAESLLGESIKTI